MTYIILFYKPFEKKSQICIMRDGEKERMRVDNDFRTIMIEIRKIARKTGINTVQVISPYSIIEELERYNNKSKITIIEI